MNSVRDVCSSYFSGFSDMHCHKRCSPGINVAGLLKIVSYFTVILPLMFGIFYACSALVGRVCPQRTRKPLDKAMIEISARTIGTQAAAQVQAISQPIKKKGNYVNALQIRHSSPADVRQKPLLECKPHELEVFFRTKQKCQELFQINGEKVGIVYDPSGGNCRMGFMTITAPIVLFSKGVTPEIKAKIQEAAPKGFKIGEYSINCLYYGSRNLSLFEHHGFEGDYLDERPCDS